MVFKIRELLGSSAPPKTRWHASRAPIGPRHWTISLRLGVSKPGQLRAIALSLATAAGLYHVRGRRN